MCDGRPIDEVNMAVGLGSLKDVVIFSQKPDEHIEHGGQVLSLITEAGVTLNSRRCKYFTNGIDYLRHAIHSSRLGVSTGTSDTELGLKPPTNLTER